MLSTSDSKRIACLKPLYLFIYARLYSYPLDKTEFFWKTNEAESIKTIEVEELSCPSKPYDNWHINRYVHAEREMQNRIFRHFDGAAKVYAQDDYRQRVDQTMPNNMRANHYMALLPNEWVNLTPLIPFLDLWQHAREDF